MRLAIVAAGFTPEEADQLRRAMATFKLTGGVARHQERLVERHGPAGLRAGFAERVFQQIEGFGDYGFPESHAASFALLVYASAWVKCHHPAVFACALLNSQPMGFYAPAQIVRDAREHGVAILAVDVNASDWDSTLEPQPASAGGLALRLGLRLVAGLPEAEARAILAARRARNGAPFASVEEAACGPGWGGGRSRPWPGRTPLPAPGPAAAGRAGRPAAWRAGRRTCRSLPPPPGRTAAAMAAQAPLVPEPAVTLPEQTEGEAVVEDYLATGLTLRRHPLALLRPTLDRAGLWRHPPAERPPRRHRLRLPGLVLIRQRPGSAKGVVFLTVEDEHGVANLVVFERIAARDRAALVSGRLLIAEGRVEREVEQAEVPITHLIVDRLVDRSDLLSRLVEIDGGHLGPGLGGEGARPGRRGAAARARQPAPEAQAAGQPGLSLMPGLPSIPARLIFAAAALPWPARRLGHAMCNLYSITKGQQAIREFTRAMSDRTGNLPPLPGVFPDYAAPIVRNQPERPRADHGPLGHALARLCAEGQEVRSGRHQRPQRQVAALAALARRREPLRRALHQLLRARGAAGRHAPAGLVRLRREPAAGLSLPASGRAGPRCGRSRRARRPTTSLPSSPPSRTARSAPSTRRPCRSS